VSATLAEAPPLAQQPRVLPAGSSTVQATSVDPVNSGRAPGESITDANNKDIVATATPVTNIDWDAAPTAESKNEPTTQWAGEKGPALDLPSDMALPDAAAGPATTPGAAAAPKVAFAGTGLEFARVYDLNGTQWPLGALDGDVILLDFFGSWCGPCRKSIPHLNELDARYGNRGLRIVGVACEYGDAATAVKSANDAKTRLDIRYHVVVSPMDDASAVRDYFKVGSYPTVILLDRQGRVLHQATGLDPATIAQLERAIEAALANR
jgi:thiol-disulfide isomerase/thioredoxin